MVLGIVGDDDHPPASANAGPSKFLQEAKECRAIELVRLLAVLKPAVANSHGGEVSNAAPRRGME